MLFVWLGVALMSSAYPCEMEDGGHATDPLDAWGADPFDLPTEPAWELDLPSPWLTVGDEIIDLHPVGVGAPTSRATAPTAMAPTAEDRAAVATEIRTRD